MKYHEIDLSGLYISLYISDNGDVQSVEIKKKKQEGTDSRRYARLITLDNIYSEDVIE
jgi:hypothetical protein